jgi:hypothetical protein
MGMIMLNYKKILIISIISLIPLSSKTMENEKIPNKKHEENKMHTSTTPIKKIENLFQKTKKLCFGRYLLNLPNEAELIIGNSEVELFKGGPESLKYQAEIELKKYDL